MINAKDKERAEQAAAEAAGAVARSTAALPALAVTASEELNVRIFSFSSKAAAIIVCTVLSKLCLGLAYKAALAVACHVHNQARYARRFVFRNLLEDGV